MNALGRWTLTLGACGALIVCGRSDALTLMVEDGEGAEGDIIPVELALLNITSAIAGFGLTVSVQDARVAPHSLGCSSLITATQRADSSSHL